MERVAGGCDLECTPRVAATAARLSASIVGCVPPLESRSCGFHFESVSAFAVLRHPSHLATGRRHAAHNLHDSRT
eukprot:6196444-Pleurochrysis_carterae.AAC.2